MRGLLVVAGSYVIGCVVGAYYVVRLATGRDIRMVGSGTAGARNVLRFVGKGSAAATLVFDIAKGSLAVWLAQRLAPSDWASGVAFTFVVLGHIWPAQLAFRGGKGAATALGCMLVIDARTALLAVALAGLVVLVTRHITASGLTGVAAAPVILALFGEPLIGVIGVAAACAVVLFAHSPASPRRIAVQDAGAAASEVSAASATAGSEP